MNSVIEQPTQAEVQVAPTTQWVTQFHDDVRGVPLLGPTFETMLLYHGHFDNVAGFDLIALETHHGGR